MKKEKIREIKIMPHIEDYEEFKKYLLKFRKETSINFHFDIKDNTITIFESKVYFYDLRSVMSFLEGVKEGVIYERTNGNKDR